MTAAPFVELVGLRKEYPGVVAVGDGSFSVAPGEIVGLVGKNGAGKSTVIKMLAGLVTPDGGEIRIEGEPARIGSPHEATRRGLAFVHQELEQAPGLSVAENIMLGTGLPRRAGVFVDWRALYERAGEVTRELDPALDPRARIDDLPVAGKRLVMVARALHRRARLLVLDEPSAALTDAEIRQLHAVCRRIRDGGGAVVYVSHRLGEILDLTDRVVVMRDGFTVLDAPTSEYDLDRLVEAIAGRRRQATPPARDVDAPAPAAREVLRVHGLSRGNAVRDVSFSVRAGEVLGLAGLAGAGRTEVLRLIFGLDRPSAGTVAVHGREVALRGPRHALRHGIALLPEDRRNQGLILDFQLRANITIGTLPRFRSRLPLVPSRARETAAARGMMTRLRIAARGPEQPVRELSGGNQQKVVLGKWLERGSDILLFDEPTAGVDVDAKEEIYAEVRGLAREERAIVFVSSDFAELERVCDRVVVIREGTVSGELDGAAVTEAAMVRLCYGEAGSPKAA